MTTTSKYRCEHTRKILSNVHSLMACAGEICPVHNLSDHAMRSFPQHWRGDRAIMERICPCGTGHDDPDDIASRKRLGREASGTHGCCGCCGAAKGLIQQGILSEDVYNEILKRRKTAQERNMSLDWGWQLVHDQ